MPTGPESKNMPRPENSVTSLGHSRDTGMWTSEESLFPRSCLSRFLPLLPLDSVFPEASGHCVSSLSYTGDKRAFR